MRSVLSPSRPREDNSVVFLEISESGHTKDTTEKATVLGRLYFELRQDIAPLACENFLQLVVGGNYSSSTGEKSRSIAENNSTNAYAKEHSGFDYHLKGTFLHRIVKDVLCQGVCVCMCYVSFVFTQILLLMLSILFQFGDHNHFLTSRLIIITFNGPHLILHLIKDSCYYYFTSHHITIHI